VPRTAHGERQPSRSPDDPQSIENADMINDMPINPLISAQRPTGPKPDSAVELTPSRDSGRVQAQDAVRPALADATEQAAERTPVNPPSEDELSAMVESINDYLQTARRELQFKVDDTSGRVLVQVLNQDSGEVIRHIPPEAMVLLADFLRAQGTFNSLGMQEKS